MKSAKSSLKKGTFLMFENIFIENEKIFIVKRFQIFASNFLFFLYVVEESGKILVVSGGKWKMLLGQYEHSLDSKQRLILPSKIKNEFSAEVYVTLDFDGCLSLYSEANYNERAKAIQSLSDFEKDNRIVKRVFFSNSQVLRIDAQSRILIPSFLLDKVHISKDVMIVGMNDHLEIWDKETFLQKEEESESNYSETAQRIMGC